MDTAIIKHADTPFGKIRYSLSGSGRPVLVIHGSGGGDDQGRLIAERFLPECRVIAVCRFGYYESDLPASPSNKKQAEAFKVILDAEGISSVDVVGLSAGGPSATEFAICYPSNCSSLILISALSSPTLDKGVRVSKVTTVMARSDFFLGLMSLFMRKKRFPRLAGIMKERIGNSDEHFLAYALNSTKDLKKKLKGILNDRLLPTIDPAEMRTIACPTLVIHAADDGLVPCSNADFAAATIPGAVKLIINEGGHLLLTEHEIIRKEINRFLNSSLQA